MMSSHLSRRAFLTALSAAVFIRRGEAQDTAAQGARLVALPLEKPLLPDAKPSSLFAFAKDETDPAIPAPVLRLKRGEPFKVIVENRLAVPTNFHAYGLRGPASEEAIVGLTSEAIAPGKSQEIVLAPRDAGTFWYHPLILGQSAEQIERGLYGPIVVMEDKPPLHDAEVIVVVDDIRLDENGSANLDFYGLTDVARAGRLGNALLVNGRKAPDVATFKPGSRIRLRIIGVSNARMCPLKFEGMVATIIAIDGQPCDPFDPLKRTVILAPGSRFDAMIDLPREAGKTAVLSAALGNGLPLIELKTDGDALPVRPPVERLEANDVPPSIRLQTAWRSELTIEGGMPAPSETEAPGAEQLAAEAKAMFPSPDQVFKLNFGFTSGFSGKPLFTVKRGLPVVLAINNKTGWGQVIHVHGHVFRLLHNFDDGWEPYLLDTLYIPPGQLSRIAFEADTIGKWAIRSSIQEHFEGGVATWFEVT
jgi:FtsP/CotA-like multicopper oxidase with cupredoxin domain